jgi:hypothetical protein
MSTQGNKQLLKCTDESCLFAIGHLLSVDLVLSGSISKSDRRYCISAELVDIKNNISTGYVQSFVMDFYDSTVVKVSHELINKLLELKSAKKVVASNVSNDQSTGQNQQIFNHSAVASRQGKPSNQTTNNGAKKSSLVKTLIWVPVAAVVLGGAAAGMFYFKSKHATGSPADNDISLDDAPKHPGTSFKSGAP